MPEMALRRRAIRQTDRFEMPMNGWPTVVCYGDLLSGARIDGATGANPEFARIGCTDWKMSPNATSQVLAASFQRAETAGYCLQDRGYVLDWVRRDVVWAKAGVVPGRGARPVLGA
jgi:hypothetical protein